MNEIYSWILLDRLFSAFQCFLFSGLDNHGNLEML